MHTILTWPFTLYHAIHLPPIQAIRCAAFFLVVMCVYVCVFDSMYDSVLNWNSRSGQLFTQRERKRYTSNRSSIWIQLLWFAICFRIVYNFCIFMVQFYITNSHGSEFHLCAFKMSNILSLHFCAKMMIRHFSFDPSLFCCINWILTIEI